MRCDIMDSATCGVCEATARATFAFQQAGRLVFSFYAVALIKIFKNLVTLQIDREALLNFVFGSALFCILCFRPNKLNSSRFYT